uniref:Uncharacterized protein n=1 Tax=Gouania willdenowi TaxID=441366 RepID=A0A8C5EAC0_GOUWI
MEERRLLLAMPEVALSLESLELAEGGGGVLVQAVGDCLSLLCLAYQHGVAPQNHCHVLHLVSIDPGQNLGATRVSGAISDPVQRIKVDGLLLP